MPSSMERMGLPVKPFFYTMDQIAMLLEVEEKYVRETLVYYMGRTVGPWRKDRLKAINIAPEGEKPEWRISERDLISYLKFKGLRFYQHGYLK